MPNNDNCWFKKRTQQIPDFIDTGKRVTFTQQEKNDSRNRLIELMKESGIEFEDLNGKFS